MNENAGRKQSIVLLFGLLLSKILGAIYRIPLSNLLGEEGIGYYQLVFPIYAFLVTLTSGAYPAAIAKTLNSVESDSGDFFKLNDFLKYGGFIGTLILVLSSGAFAALQGRSELAVCYCLLAPSVTICAVAAGIKGWFQSKCDMMPSALSAVSEQVFKLLFGLLAVWLLRDRGVLFAVMGATFSVTIAELITLLILKLYAFKHSFPCEKKTAKTLENDARIRIFSVKKLKCDTFLNTVLPMTLSGMITPLVAFIDSLLLIPLLSLFGYGEAYATASYGIYSGAVMTIVNLPIVVTLALSAYIVPVIAAQNRSRKIVSVRSESAFVIKSAFFICAVPAVLIAVFADAYLPILYSSFSSESLNVAAKMLMIAAVGIPFSVLLQMYGSVLNALSFERAVLNNTVFSAVVKLILTVSMTLKWGIFGIVVANVVGVAISCVVLKAYLDKMIGRNGKTDGGLTLGVLCAVLSAFVGYVFAQFFKMSVFSFLLGSALCVTIFVLLTFICRVFDRNELTSLLEIVKIKSNTKGQKEKEVI